MLSRTSGNSVASSSMPITQAHRPVYRLPIARLHEMQESEPKLQMKGHYVVAGAPLCVDVRVDWDGVATGHGTFEVQLGDAGWQLLPNSEPTREIDVISAEHKLIGQSLLVRFERGQAHPTTPFKVRALPIEWSPEMTESALDGTRNTGFTALRDTHYRVTVDPDTVEWQASSEMGGAHSVELALVVGTDYELWVDLQSPADPGEWHKQDPIIRTGNSGGN